MTEDNTELASMRQDIQEMEMQLKEMKKAYHEKRNEGLTLALEARKAADIALREELSRLGYSPNSSKFLMPNMYLRNNF